MTCMKPNSRLKTLLTGAIAALASTTTVAQSPCPEDSLALNVTVTTDNWGFEMYWELLAVGSECGDGEALLWGGNPEVGCGGGVPGLPGEAYGNNVIVSSPTLCVSEGDSLILVHRDSYGDGGSQFSIALTGMEVYAFGGTGSGDDWMFQTSLMAGDQPCLAEPIVANGPSWVGSTVEASVSPGEPAPPALGCGTYGGWCESGLNRTMWLVWDVPEEGGVYSVTTCNEGTSFDTQLAMWHVEDCMDYGTYELVNANDDIGCDFGAYRSGFLTPCLQGGETFYLQIDGWYGEVGDVEVSITSASPEEWAVSASVQDLSCSLETDFNPNGAIYANTNVGPNAVEWQWTGPFGFTSEEAVLGPLLPGVYELSASFCGQSYSEQFEVAEPAPIDAQVTLTADCDAGAMSGLVVVDGGQGEVDATWSVGSFEALGSDVVGLPSGLCLVDVVDENGCSTSEWVWVDAVGVPSVDLGPDLFGCAGDAFTLLAPLGNNLTYTWTTGQAGPLVVVQTENPGTLVVGVEVSDAAGCSDTDAIILTLDDCASGLENVLATQGSSALHVYPNPFEDQLTIEWPESMSLQAIHMHDLSGKEIPCTWTRQGTWVTANLDVPAGMYVVTCDEVVGGVRVVRR